MSKLEDILELYKRHILKKENGQFMNYERLNATEAAQQILDLCLECVGEDEAEGEGYGAFQTTILRNNQKAEIRQRLQEALRGNNE